MRISKPEDYEAWIAFVDYDGKQKYENFRESHPKTRSDEPEFAPTNGSIELKH